MDVEKKRNVLRSRIRSYASVFGNDLVFAKLAPYPNVSSVPETLLEDMIDRFSFPGVPIPVKVVKFITTSERRSIQNRAFEAREQKPVRVRQARRFA